MLHLLHSEKSTTCLLKHYMLVIFSLFIMFFWVLGYLDCVDWFSSALWPCSVVGFHFITSGFCSFRKQASNSKTPPPSSPWVNTPNNLWLFLQYFCRGLFGDLQLTASLKSLSWISEMTHLKCLAVRRLDTRPVKMNHAMQHMAPTVLFAGLLLLAQSDACCLWPAMAPDDEARHAGFLELCAASLELRCSDSLCFLWNDADWWANSTELDGVKINK